MRRNPIRLLAGIMLIAGALLLGRTPSPGPGPGPSPPGPGPGPVDPDKPNPPQPTGDWAATEKVSREASNGLSKKSEVSGVLETVATQAAAGAFSDLNAMMTAASEGVREALGDDDYFNWRNWRTAFVKELERLAGANRVGDDPQSHVEAFLAFAKGLQ